MKTIASLIALLVASTAVAQPLTVGRMPNSATYGLGGTFATSAPYSIIDIGHPATSNGPVDRASVMWSFACTGAFKLVFLRPGNSPSSLGVTAVRGPYDAIAGRVDVVLSPPVPLIAGDVMALVQLKPGVGCGGPSYSFQSRGNSAAWLSLNDISEGGTLASNAVLQRQRSFAMMAFSADPVLVRVVPAAGAVQGAGGAFFRTSLQLFSDTSGPPITGKLVFRRSGTPGSDGDPSLPFTIRYRETLSFGDVVAAMNTSGLGSLDVYTTGGQELVVSARIFNDAGASGTSGFTEEGLAPSEARRTVSGSGALLGVLLVPADLVNYRMNVGVRTLESGAAVTVRTYDAGGALLSTRTEVTYAANYFEQVSATQFTGLATLPAGGSIVVEVTGAAFIYGSVTDNRTQDSSMRMAEMK